MIVQATNQGGDTLATSQYVVDLHGWAMYAVVGEFTHWPTRERFELCHRYTMPLTARCMREPDSRNDV